MITESFQMTGYTLTFTYGYKTTGGTPTRKYYYFYTGQRIIWKFVGQSSYVVNGITYYADTDGVLLLDLTDLFRANLVTGAVTTLDGLFNYLTFFGALPGIDPEACLIPVPPIFAGDQSITSTQIMPPSKIYAHEQLSYEYPMAVQLYGEASQTMWQGIFQEDSENPVTIHPDETSGNFSVILPNETEEESPDFIRTLYSTNLGVSIDLDILPACVSVCVLRWLSESGKYKQAIWRIKKVKKAATSRGLLPLADEYKTQKGEEVSFTAFIDGLDNYDLSYYGDIITSPDVHCALHSGENLTGYETAVQVTTGSYIIPDGHVGELQTLEINIAYKHYDTV